MAIEFYCKNCKKRLRCPDSAAGTKARCPQCSEINNVPLVSDPPATFSGTAEESIAREPLSSPGQVSPPSWQPPAFAPPAAPTFGPSSALSTGPSTGPQAYSPPPFPAGSSRASETAGSGEIVYPPSSAPNPFAATPDSGMAPPPPTGDQSGLASSLGVVSIIMGGMSLVFGCCCAPVSAVSSVAALGLGIWGLIAANNQLKQTRFAPHLRHLEPPARTAQILSVIGIVISGLSTLIFGALGILTIISMFAN